MRKLISKRFGLLSALLLTFVAVGGLAFAAKAHKHTFEKKWTTDETNHWHVATCEHTEELGALEAHKFGGWVSNKDATCTKDGTKSAKCKTCGYVRTVTDEGSAKGHKSDAGTITKAATTKVEGEKIYKCSVCGETLNTEVLPKLYAFHETVEKVDTVTINGTVYDIVTFGDYPQTIKAKDVTIYEDQSIVMGQFTYYLGSDSCYYAKGEPKRGWYDDYYYDYYKVEPIRWRVVTKNYNDSKKALLVAEKILISGITYYGDYGDRGEWRNGRTANGKEINNSNYLHSQARAYLNGLTFGYGQDEFGSETFNKKWENKGFLQTAFTSTAQGKIAVTTVDNSMESGVSFKDNACENTKDKIFLLSIKEVSNVAYGFPLIDKKGPSRLREPTDFSYSGNRCGWYLRTPDMRDTVYYVWQKRDWDGESFDEMSGELFNTGTSDKDIGLVPALTISY